MSDEPKNGRKQHILETNGSTLRPRATTRRAEWADAWHASSVPRRCVGRAFRLAIVWFFGQKVVSGFWAK